MICAIAGHKAAAKTIWNQGTHFSTCSRCSLDLVEQDGRWEAPPPWLRVVWRKPEPALEAEQAQPLAEMTDASAEQAAATISQPAEVEPDPASDALQAIDTASPPRAPRQRKPKASSAGRARGSAGNGRKRQSR